MSLKASLLKNIPSLRIGKRRFFRGIPRPFLSTILESGPNFYKNGRYSLEGRFSGLYFSGTIDLSKKETDIKAGRDMVDVVYKSFEISVDRILDLTSETNRRKTGVTLEELVKPRHMREAYRIPQRIAQAVYLQGWNGILAPSVHDPDHTKENWVNLIVYPANLIRPQIKPLD